MSSLQNGKCSLQFVDRLGIVYSNVDVSIADHVAVGGDIHVDWLVFDPAVTPCVNLLVRPKPKPVLGLRFAILHMRFNPSGRELRLDGIAVANNTQTAIELGTWVHIPTDELERRYAAE